ncbi:aldo/keto reductase [Anabaena cylindrica FACHB-243]|uniref:NADP-dependent oxidoreductase domain protein n=1 Tax=Anabaena cylindrica (strain ATCC 27899 / PCC 7122) TaxID=272123 RepID=K9ZCS1_ANACC|nr:MULTISPECIES: aldo/keto reductase [Anabaena]AFZ56519.1 NADP-dependent oxidoreductase domain protein [Anabaena cylindrica PCC 7122]MBD2418555.1 aldo/keto reductase [Anabaena cylindrica FACHB-243]MBY5284174.1 aldo/keto reductase [Anabaena sp. CCAP 1446/1C]MBY5310877.1 aldo/keto reductase [Anabaena sp. CCAP 1446/1C]MCM2409931.1 aldo/keto reductase [Anabaena sp. CCAP 1446/1C]
MQTNQTLSLPNMGCGTWAWGNQLLWGYNESMDDQLQQVFNLCVNNGVTLFDTGDSYGTGRLNGRSELLLGRFAREYDGINKNNICIATKLAAYPWRWTRKSIISACHASAKRLGKNVDLVQMHWSTANYAPWQEVGLLDGLADLYEQGLVKGVGLSNYGTKRLLWVHKRFQERGIPIKTLQVQYSLLSTYPVTELGLKDVCDDLGIKLIAYSPLALGLLTGKFSENGNFPKGVRGFLFKQILPGIKGVLGTLQEIANSRNKTMSQVAINWCICKGTIPIPGAKNLEQAQQNIGALGWFLNDGEVAELDNAAAKSEKKMVQNIFQTR